jgi:hypothetical protein
MRRKETAKNIGSLDVVRGILTNMLRNLRAGGGALARLELTIVVLRMLADQAG